MTWYRLSQWELFVGTSQKVGSSALSEMITKQFPVERHRDSDQEFVWHEDDWPRYWCVRHPWDRFRSLWAHQYWNKLRPEVLLNRIRISPDTDPHWKPQWKHQGCTNCELFLLKDLDQWWLDQGGETPMIHRHVTQGQPFTYRRAYNWDETLRERVEEVYYEDLELWWEASEIESTAYGSR